MDSRSVVESFFASWRVQDAELTVTHFHDDALYTIHNGAAALPFSGVFRGREGYRELAYAVLAEFDYLKYDPTILGVDGDVVRARVDYTYHHRATGNRIAGTRRLRFEIKDGLIYRLDGFDDAPRFEAFMRLTQQGLRVGCADSASAFWQRELFGS